MKWPKLLTDLFKKKEVLPPGARIPGKKYQRPRTSPETGPAIAGEPRVGVKTHKFTPAYRKKIIKHIAQCDDTHEIRQIVKAETGMDISTTQIDQYRHSKKWMPIIEKERQAYLNNVQDVPGYHDKVRLARADKIYKAAIASDNPELALKATEQQRKEVKESNKQPVSFVFQQYNNLSQDELDDKYQKALEAIEAHKKKKSITIK